MKEKRFEDNFYFFIQNKMGYAHYYQYNRKNFGEIDENGYPVSEKFWEKREDFVNITYNVCEEAKEMGIDLGNGIGEAYPVIYDGLISFTGSKKQRINQWTYKGDKQLSDIEKELLNNGLDFISFGKGLQRPSSDVVLNENEGNKLQGEWFAGVTLDTPKIRVNDSDIKRGYVDGSYEAFYLPSNIRKEVYGEGDWKQGYTKTNFYPYDIVVTAILIAGQVIFGNKAFRVSSDGYKKDFVLGYNLLRRIKSNYNFSKFHLKGEYFEIVCKQLEKKHGNIRYRYFDYGVIYNDSIDTKYGKFMYRIEDNEIHIMITDKIYQKLIK